jgi:hypothetical protein
MKNVFTKKLNQVIWMISRGKFTAAQAKLETDVLDKTNGCAVGGAPDDDDWIMDCVSQDQFYQFGMATINMIQ